MANELFIRRKFIPISRHDKCKCVLENLLSFFEYEDPQRWPELVRIVARSEIVTLKRYIEQCTDIRICDKHGNSPLHLAVIFKQDSIFTDLMAMTSVNVNSWNRYGQGPLHLAVLNDSEHYVRALLAKGADPTLSDEAWCTPLHVAAVTYRPKICEILLENGADLDIQNLLGKTALYHACQYGSVDGICMMLYYGAGATITDVYGVLPITVAMQRPEVTKVHDVLYNHTFEDEKLLVNLSVLTAAMKINSPLFPKILKKIQDVRYSKHDLSDLCRSAISINPDYFQMFVRKCGYVVREMLLNPSDLHSQLNSLGNVDRVVVKLMDFMTRLFKLRPSYNFVKGSSNFTYFISTLVSTHKNGKISYEMLQQMIYFLYSHGLPCELVHVVTVYENCGFCDIVKFMLDLDIMITYERPQAIMPYLICEINLTLDRFIELVRRPSKQYRSGLKFFADPKLRQFLGTSGSFRKKLDRVVPSVPSLIELSREVARKHIIQVFKIDRTRDFYRVVRDIPINEVYKKILIYERPIYRF